jgi:hypothetical protein
MNIRQYNDWFDYIGKVSEKERRQWAKKVIEDLKSRANEERNKKVADLVKLLEDKSKCKIVGFLPFIEYARIFGPKETLEPNYLHAWGSTVLICVLNGLPAILLVGANINWSDDEGFKG